MHARCNTHQTGTFHAQMHTSLPYITTHTEQRAEHAKHDLLIINCEKGSLYCDACDALAALSVCWLIACVDDTCCVVLCCAACVACIMMCCADVL